MPLKKYEYGGCKQQHCFNFFLNDVKDMMNQRYQLHIPLPTLPLLQKTEKRGVSGGNKI